MVNLNTEQEAALARFAQAVADMRTADQAWAVRELELRKEFKRDVEAQMRRAVTTAMELRVPKARLAKAYGTTDRRTVYSLIEQYTDTSGVFTPVPQPKDTEPTVSVVPRGDGTYSLSVYDWPAEHSDGTLTYENVVIRASGLLKGRPEDDELPLQRELLHNEAFRRKVKEEM